VEIDGERYWDGGILSNTPLSYLLDQGSDKSSIIYQVDLFRGAGDLPANLEEVKERAADIQYASRRLFGINQFQRLLEKHVHLARLLKKLPAALQNDPDVQKLRAGLRQEALTLVRLVNQTDTRSNSIKGYDFSRATVCELWSAGMADFAQLCAEPAAHCLVDLGTTLRVYDNAASTAARAMAAEIHLPD